MYISENRLWKYQFKYYRIDVYIFIAKFDVCYKNNKLIFDTDFGFTSQIKDVSEEKDKITKS